MPGAIVSWVSSQAMMRGNGARGARCAGRGAAATGPCERAAPAAKAAHTAPTALRTRHPPGPVSLIREPLHHARAPTFLVGSDGRDAERPPSGSTGTGTKDRSEERAVLHRDDQPQHEGDRRRPERALRHREVKREAVVELPPQQPHAVRQHDERRHLAPPGDQRPFAIITRLKWASSDAVIVLRRTISSS